MADVEFRLVTSVGPEDVHVVEELRDEGLNVDLIPSPTSIYFVNMYGSDPDKRTQKVLSKARPFSSEDLKDEKAQVFHLGTLLDDDFDIEVIKDLSKRGKVSVDIQGYLREVKGEEVCQVDYPLKEAAMPYIDILKANEIEMKVLTGETSARKAAEKIAGWGCREVILTLGHRGSLILSDGKFYEIPSYRTSKIVDATGCGDTYMAGYLYARSRGYDISAAGKFASALCAIKLGRKGPSIASESDVREITGQH